MDIIIPSQKRWIGYFESFLQNGRQYDSTPIVIHSIRLGTRQSFKYYHLLGKYIFYVAMTFPNIFILSN